MQYNLYIGRTQREPIISPEFHKSFQTNVVYKYMVYPQKQLFEIKLSLTQTQFPCQLLQPSDYHKKTMLTKKISFLKLVFCIILISKHSYVAIF
jgi:hypothetical protein